MIINGASLLLMHPIVNMLDTKQRDDQGVSFGLAEVGYDIRLKQDVKFHRRGPSQGMHHNVWDPETDNGLTGRGRFCLASAYEQFEMPSNLAGIVHDKSTWARKGLSVFNTVIEPGWRGFLTLELVYHGNEDLIIPAGSGIAQVIFHQLSVASSYEGKYQDQANQPVSSLLDEI